MNSYILSKVEGLDIYGKAYHLHILKYYFMQIWTCINSPSNNDRFACTYAYLSAVSYGCGKSFIHNLQDVSIATFYVIISYSM